MPGLREKGKPEDVREEPIGKPAVFFQRVQKILHTGTEKAGNPGRDAPTGHQDVLCGGQRARRGQDFWHEQGQRVQLDKKTTSLEAS